MHTLAFGLATAALLASSGLRAQEALHQLDSPWQLPIHAPAEAPADAAGVLWASGSDFKVAFDRGVAFYPLLGDAYERNLPLHWELAAVRRGENRVSVDATAMRSYDATRFTRHHAGFEERYDLRTEGVEQSFVFAELPQGEGDLVIEGLVATELRAAERSPLVGPLDFHGPAGEALVRYGAALAFDASGRTIDVATSYIDRVLSLHVPAAWLADAVLPVTVDPLLSRFMPTALGQVPGAMEIAWDGENLHRLMAYTRRFSASDWDLNSRVVTELGGTLHTYYNDVTANTSVEDVSAAYIGGADRWALAFERLDTSARTARILVHLRDDGLAPAAGTTLQVIAGAAEQHRRPSIGGSRAHGYGTTALLVFQEDASSNLSETDNTRVRGVIVDVVAQTLGAELGIGYGSANSDEENASVSRSSASMSDSWMVVWQRYNNSITDDDWDIYGRLVRPDGTLGAPDIVAGATNGTHALRPKVDGREGRFLVLSGQTPKTQRSYPARFAQVRASRIDWILGNAPSFPHPSRTIASNAAEVFDFGTPASRPIAFDHFTRSHWTAAWVQSDYQLRGARLGFDAGVAESQTIYSQALDLVPSVAIAFDASASRRFALAFPVQDPSGVHPIYMQDWSYGPAQSIPYGSTCGGTIEASNAGALVPGTPHAGSEYFALRLNDGVPSAPTALFVALGSAAFPLGGGCELLLDPASFFLYGVGTSDWGGNLQLAAPLIAHPFAHYDLYWQWAQIDPGTSALHLSDGLRTLIQ
ncbi:MAG: hypothetical protein IPN34_19060 [Planctomycetes bacterium]|nr:hypothetical protein [Planctomycetota bacterium]